MGRAETSGARQASPLTPRAVSCVLISGALFSLLRSREPVEVPRLCACRFVSVTLCRSHSASIFAHVSSTFVPFLGEAREYLESLIFAKRPIAKLCHTAKVRMKYTQVSVAP